MKFKLIALGVVMFILLVFYVVFGVGRNNPEVQSQDGVVEVQYQ